MPMLTTGAGAPAGGWTPASLPGLAPSLSVALQRQMGRLWQNTAKTLAATADGDPVRVATCPWTGIDYVAPSDAARPLLWDEGGGKWSLYFDGIDDRLTTAASYGPASALLVGCRMTFGDQFWGVFVGQDNLTVRQWQFDYSSSSVGMYVTNGGSFPRASAGSVSVTPAARTCTAWWDGSTVSAQINAGSVGSTAAALSLSAGSVPLSIGSRGDGANFLDGRVSAAVVAFAQSAASRSLLQSYLGSL